MRPINYRNVPPPLETIDYTNLLENFASWIKPEKYLQIGMGNGIIFQKIGAHCKEAVGVDLIDPVFVLPSNSTYHRMDAERFYNNYKDSYMSYDMIFINSSNTHEQTMKEFLYFKDSVITDGFVFIKGTYPFDINYSTPETLGDCYKTPIKIKEDFSQEWEVVTLPFNPGITICKKVMANRSLLWL